MLTFAAGLCSTVKIYDKRFGKNLHIHVSCSMADAETFRRETDGLIRFASVQRLKRMMVETKDEGNVVENDGYRIEIFPLWKWLLEY